MTLFSPQDGTPFPDVLFESALLGKGITFIAGGFTGGDWAGKNAGSTDFVAVAIDDKSKRASEVWRWQVGKPGGGYRRRFTCVTDQIVATLEQKTAVSHIIAGLGIMWRQKLITNDRELCEIRNAVFTRKRNRFWACQTRRTLNNQT